ncbi:MAG: HAD family hydrolase [Candidatus Eisenbacteria bacterium]
MLRFAGRREVGPEAAEEKPAVFLDRDGTLVHQVGFVNHPARLRPYPFTARAVRALNDRGIPAVVVTNQSGIGRGIITEEVLEKTHERLRRILALGGAHIDGMYVCPHHPTEGPSPRRCRCRKPGTLLVGRAARELGLDSKRSFFVGDSEADILTGRRAGGRTVLVLTGYGRGELNYRRRSWKAEPDHIAVDLEKAVEWILERVGE